MAEPGVRLQEVLATLDDIAAFSLAATWDNVGLMVGDPTMTVTGIMVALDPTEEVLAEAHTRQANVLVTHHPLIFQPLKAMRTDQPLGRLLALAARQNMAVVACHTNLDMAKGGVNDVLAARLGLSDIAAFPANNATSAKNIGLGRSGRYNVPLAAKEFTERLMASLDIPDLRVVGKLPPAITRVAVCGGSGADLAEAAWQEGNQVLVTAEVKLSIARWAETAGLCIVDAGHFATENVIVPVLAKALRERLTQSGHEIEVCTTATQKDPFVLCAATNKPVTVNHNPSL